MLALWPAARYAASCAPQVRLFSSAKAVVGPHGGGFANILFAPPGALVVEVDNQGESCCYEAMSAALELRHLRLRGNFSWETPELEVDPAIVVRAVVDNLAFALPNSPAAGAAL